MYFRELESLYELDREIREEIKREEQEKKERD